MIWLSEILSNRVWLYCTIPDSCLTKFAENMTNQANVCDAQHVNNRKNMTEKCNNIQNVEFLQFHTDI